MRMGSGDTRFFMIVDPGERIPWALVSFNRGMCERWKNGVWVPDQTMVGYFVNGEIGAEEVSPEHAAEIMRNGLPGQIRPPDSDLMKILRGADEDAKMRALIGFSFQPTARASMDGGMADDYDTTVAPNSWDEVEQAANQGLITRAQVMAPSRALHEATLAGPSSSPSPTAPPGTEPRP